MGDPSLELPRESLRTMLRRVSFFGMVARRLTEVTVRHWLLQEAHRLEREVEEIQTGLRLIDTTVENRQSHMWRCIDQASILRRMIRRVDQ